MFNHQKTDGMFCPHCSKIINKNVRVCPDCGGKIKPQYSNLWDTTPSGKNRILAALLAFFFGTFGVHRFYLGSIGLAILYLLFCWTGIPTIISVVESILFLVMEPEEFERKYG